MRKTLGNSACFSDGTDNTTSSASPIICSRSSFLKLGLDSAMYPRHTSMLSSVEMNISVSQEGPTPPVELAGQVTHPCLQKDHPPLLPPVDTTSFS